MSCSAATFRPPNITSLGSLLSIRAIAERQVRREQQRPGFHRLHRRQLCLSRRRLRDARPRSSPTTAPISRACSISSPPIRACRRRSATRCTSYGLAPDEFTDNGGWSQSDLRPRGPPHGRRLRDDRPQRAWARSGVTDSVGLGSYTLDSHNTRAVRRRGRARAERRRRTDRRAASPTAFRTARLRPRREPGGEPARNRPRSPRPTPPTARSAWSRCSWSWARRPARRPRCRSTPP